MGQQMMLKLGKELVAELLPMPVTLLREIRLEWENELQRKGIDPRLSAWCMKLVDLVIQQKEARTCVN